ncbi:hypothetical protein [Virgibacillus chiguensis]|nr:hypothetical protein [Virgibacillus chiguensis]
MNGLKTETNEGTIKDNKITVPAEMGVCIYEVQAKKQRLYLM